MRPGDRVFIYHRGGVSAIVGMAKVSSAGRPDPKNPKSAVADLAFLSRLDTSHLLWRKMKQSSGSRIGRWCVKGVFRPWPRRKKFVEWMRKRYPGQKI